MHGYFSYSHHEAVVDKYKFIVGLTGGIGSGKSTVSKFLSSWSIDIIDADKISREITAPNGLAIAGIKKVFGEAFIKADNSLNRDMMRTVVFNSATEKNRLETIIHPLVQQQMLVQATHAKSPYVVLDIPLLVESIERYSGLIDRVCVVDCDEVVQIQRVIARSQLSEMDIKKIIGSQAPRKVRLARAHDIINNGLGVNLDDLREQVYNLHQQWLVMAA